MATYTQTFTLTAGDVAENHKGMQQIGNMADKGFSKENLVTIQNWFQERDCNTEMIKLHNNLPDKKNENKAYVLIIREGVNKILNDMTCAAKLYTEQENLEKDTKALMYGRVVNKHARYNLCFAEEAQEPNYIEGKGRIISFNNVVLLNSIRQRLGEILPEASNLMFEGNYYYDVTSCGIGWHGDYERAKVIGIRLGASMPLCFNWFHKNQPLGEKITLNLNHGDIYVMSEKAVGQDWKKMNSYTLRHSAGADKYTKL